MTDRPVIPSGWVLVDKSVGITSAQVVRNLKRILNLPRSVRIGHGGTLDPFASGLLPVAVGEACKVVSYVLAGDKGYDFTLRFGEKRSSGDPEGMVVATCDRIPKEEAIIETLPQFTGRIEQTPPARSAIKIGGKRAYTYAREGKSVTIPKREVVIHRLDFLGMEGRDARFSVRCSKGSYIRSLGEDIAEAIGSLGYLNTLRRIFAEPFHIEDSISLDKCKQLMQDQTLGEFLLPFKAGLADIPVLPISSRQSAALQRGQRLTGLLQSPDVHLATCADIPIALVAQDLATGAMRILRNFNLWKGVDDVD